MRALGCFLLLVLLMPASAFADLSLAENHGCTQCHRFTQEASEEPPKGPDLFYAGNKFQKNWLENFLQNPVVVRKAGYTSDPGFLKGTPTVAQPHPSLPEKEAREMTDFLMSLKLSDLPASPVEGEPLTKGEKVRIKILFERNFGCIACHEGVNLAGQPRGGISGPSLANAGNRLTADWVFHWLKTPEKFLPKSRMPLYDLDDETAVKLTQYLMTLKIGRQN